MVIGRLKPEVAVQQAKADLSAISARLEQQYPEDDKGWGATVVPLREEIVGDVRPALLVLIRSLLRLSSVQPGFDPNNVLTARLTVPGTKFSSPAAQINFYDQVLRQVRATPGVESAGLIDSLPMNNGGSHQPVAVAGHAAVPTAEHPD